MDLNWLSSAFRPDTQAVPEQDTGKAPPPEQQGFHSFSDITREEEEPSQVCFKLGKPLSAFAGMSVSNYLGND